MVRVLPFYYRNGTFWLTGRVLASTVVAEGCGYVGLRAFAPGYCLGRVG